MSSTAPIIDPLRFAEALADLPLDALYSKAAELHNSISQLRSSNAQMLPFADAGDADCKEAMLENLGVIGRMRERVGLIKGEVEGRGQVWHLEGGNHEGGQVQGSGVGTEAGEQIWVERGAVNGDAEAAAPGLNGLGRSSGRLTDEELRAQLEARMAEDEGVHL